MTTHILRPIAPAGHATLERETHPRERNSQPTPAWPAPSNMSPQHAPALAADTDAEAPPRKRQRGSRSGTVEGCALRSIFADNVRGRAKAIDLRLNALADRAGVSRSQFYNVLRQSSSPSLDWVAKIAAVLGVTPAQLLMPPAQADYDYHRGEQGHAQAPHERRPNLPAQTQHVHHLHVAPHQPAITPQMSVVEHPAHYVPAIQYPGRLA